MRIAYISYEHPLGITGGGIGTYLGQIASLMSDRGHDVEVFTCYPLKSEVLNYQGYTVNRIQAASKEAFRNNVVEVFRLKQMISPFNLIEAAEYNADAYFVNKHFLEIPLVIKLHTPDFLIIRLNAYKANAVDKLRYLLGGIRRGKLVKPYWIYRKNEDIEYWQFLQATSVCSPSYSLANIIKKEWESGQPIEVIPNLFIPNKGFLNIPVARYTEGKIIISFFGRLEKRKGILDLMNAIPNVLQSHQNVVFRFIGKPHPSPDNRLNMEDYIRHHLKKHLHYIEFLGPQPYENIPGLMAETHICIFPSLWENFPNVCLEAMAAGRAVIASNNGGMADMITDQKEGLLIKPNNTKSIAKAILSLCNEPQKIEQLGKAARKKVLEAYNAEKIGVHVEDFYRKAIACLSLVK